MEMDYDREEILRPAIPWGGLFMSGYAFLTGLGAASLIPLFIGKGLWMGALTALAIGGILMGFGIYEGRRMLRVVLTRKEVGRRRMAMVEEFERRFEAAAEEDRGKLFADELEAILGGKRE